MHCKLSVRLTCSVIYIFMTLVRLSSSSLGTLAWVTTSRSLRWRYGPSWQPLCSCLMIWGTFVLAPRGCCRTDTSLPSIRTRWAIKDTSLPRWVRRDMEWQLSAFIVHLVSVWRGAQSPDDKSILTRSEPLLHFGFIYVRADVRSCCVPVWHKDRAPCKLKKIIYNQIRGATNNRYQQYNILYWYCIRNTHTISWK